MKAVDIIYKTVYVLMVLLAYAMAQYGLFALKMKLTGTTGTMDKIFMFTGSFIIMFVFANAFIKLVVKKP